MRGIQSEGYWTGHAKEIHRLAHAGFIYGADAMKRKKKSAFTIVLVMPSYPLLGVMLAAVAVAVHASIHSHGENQSLASVTQTARWILNRMTHEIRTAAAVDSTETQISIIPPDDGSDVQQIQYEFSDSTLYYRQTINGSVEESILLGSADDVTVSTFHVIREVGLDWQGLPCTKSITVRLGLVIDNQTFWVTASASPRRNQEY